MTERHPKCWSRDRRPLVGITLVSSHQLCFRFIILQSFYVLTVNSSWEFLALCCFESQTELNHRKKTIEML